MEEPKNSQSFYQAIKNMDKNGLNATMCVGDVWDDLVEPLEINFNRRSSSCKLFGKYAKELILMIEEFYEGVKCKRGGDWSELALLPLSIEWAKARFAPLNPCDFRRSLIVFVTVEEFALLYEWLNRTTFTGLISGL